MPQIPSFLLNLLPRQLLRITDYRGRLVISIDKANFVLCKAMDNNVRLWYKDGRGEINDIIFRQKLQAVEKMVCGDNIVRCHRSYIVNLEYVKIIEPFKKGYRMDVGIFFIPVSTSFIDRLTSKE